MKLRLFKVLLLVVVNVVITATAFELYYRYVHDTTDMLNYGLASEKWRDRHIFHNSTGQRDVEHIGNPLHTDENIIRLFVIGDSFTYGLGVKDTDDRYGDLICTAVRKKVSNLHCYNISFPRWDLQSYADAFEKYAVEFQAPDVVLMQFFMNDIEIYTRNRDRYAGISQAEHEAHMEYVHGAPANPVLKYIYHKSFAFNFFFLRYRLATVPSELTYEEVLKSDFVDLRKYQLVEDELNRITVLGEMYDAQLGVVIFPLVDGSRQEYLLDGAHQAIHVSLAHRGIPFVDMKESFWRYAPRELMVNRFDGHPNEKAHRLTAQETLDMVAVMLEKKAAWSGEEKFAEMKSCVGWEL